MAHELDFTTGRAAFAQLTGSPNPWHGFLNEVTHGASIEEWRREGGLAWDVQAAVIGYDAVINGEPFRMLDDESRVLYRTDNGARLGIVSASYKIHSIQEIFESFRTLCENTDGGGWRIATVGALKGGAVIWAQAFRDETGEVSPGDTIHNSLVLSTSFDGSQPTRAIRTHVRTVCMNTLRAGFAAATRKATQRHRGKFDAAKTIGAVLDTDEGRDSFKREIEILRRLAETPVDPFKARQLVHQILTGKAPRIVQDVNPQPTTQVQPVNFADLLQLPNRATADAPAVSNSELSALGLRIEGEHRNVDPIINLFLGQGAGSDLEGARGTLWGLLNGVTDFVDHQAARTVDTRVMSANFGQGAALKDSALALMVQTAADAAATA